MKFNDCSSCLLFFPYSGLDRVSSSTLDFNLDCGPIEIDPIKAANILMQFFWDESNQYTYKKWKKKSILSPIPPSLLVVSLHELNPASVKHLQQAVNSAAGRSFKSAQLFSAVGLTIRPAMAWHKKKASFWPVGLQVWLKYTKRLFSLASGEGVYVSLNPKLLSFHLSLEIINISICLSSKQ